MLTLNEPKAQTCNMFLDKDNIFVILSYFKFVYVYINWFNIRFMSIIELENYNEIC